MHVKFSLFAFMALGLALSACDNGSDARYIEPNEYLPAYPGSYWDYSDGSRVRATDYELHSYRLSTTSTEKSEECFVPVWDGKYLYKYSIYQSSPNYPMKELLRAKGSAEWVVDENNGVRLKRSEATDTMRIKVPVDSNVFEYTLFNRDSVDIKTVKDTLFRKVLVDSVTKAFRYAWVSKDSVSAKDTLFTRKRVDVVTVVKDSLFKVYRVTEYLETLDDIANWNIREYYAKNIGLVKVEVNNPNDSLGGSVVQKEIKAFFINKPK